MNQVTMSTVADVGPPRLVPTDEQLEAGWADAPNVEVLKKAAGLAAALALPRQAQWSGRLRSAGYWHLCPLVAVAQDQSKPIGARVAAAAAAWDLDRDRQARAVLRVLLPQLPGGGAAEARAAMSAAAWAELEGWPLTWSVTPFFNELDLMQARLFEMARKVDRFLVVEARQTFRGEPKPLYFEQNRDLFRRWSAQIDHVAVDLPEGPDPWARERHQRDLAQQVLAGLGAQNDDLVLLTDLDEVVRAAQADLIMQATAATPVVLAMEQYWYSLRWKEPKPWLHPKAFRFGQVPAGRSYHETRHTPFPAVPNAGWHISWFGDEGRFDRKLRSFSHSEFDTPERREASFQRALISGGTDIHGRPLLPAHDYFPASFSCLFDKQGA